MLVVAAFAALAPVTPLLAQAAPLSVPAGEYVLEKTHASLTWKINHLGLSYYTARFTGFDATINLDPKVVTNSSVSVTIDPRSVKTDFPFPEKEDFDKVIAEKVLMAGEHPTITFQSTSLKATGKTTGKLTGNLTLMGVTKPVTLDVTLNGAKEHPMRKVPVLGVSATGSFKRSDFGSNFLLGPVGDEITVLIELEFLKK
ncbi:polyisoprenoid-binding protein [Sandaracinobacter neustonicus]|uniref:Polyisoprenoid-binding protein n=2 Tax=Sandaracinobacter neustonicus TaxID=1715348 RepID=A0A501XTQ2_9SPHN|nr:polyisoprenoid-binding protein [Sandaracinobacter neustonicus]